MVKMTARSSTQVFIFFSLITQIALSSGKVFAVPKRNTATCAQELSSAPAAEQGLSSAPAAGQGLSVAELIAQATARSRNGELKPRFLDPAEEMRIAELLDAGHSHKEGGGVDPQVKEFLKDYLPANVQVLPMELASSVAPGLVSINAGMAMHVRIMHPFKGRVIGVNAVISGQFLVFNKNREKKWLIGPEASWTYFWEHGGGTKTTGPHTAAGIIGQASKYGAGVFAVALPGHEIGPRDQFKDANEYFEFTESLLKTYVHSSVVKNGSGHSMGGLLSIMRWYRSDNNQVDVSALDGYIALAGVMDQKPGGTLREKAWLEAAKESMLKQENMQKLLSPGDQTVGEDLARAGKISAYCGIFCQRMGLDNDQSIPSHMGALFKPALFIWGRHDYLVVGNEDLIMNYLIPLQNSEVRILGPRVNFKGEVIQVGHLLFDHFKLNASAPEEITAIQPEVMSLINGYLIKKGTSVSGKSWSEVQTLFYNQAVLPHEGKIFATNPDNMSPVGLLVAAYHWEPEFKSLVDKMISAKQDKILTKKDVLDITREFNVVLIERLQGASKGRLTREELAKLKTEQLMEAIQDLDPNAVNGLLVKQQRITIEKAKGRFFLGLTHEGVQETYSLMVDFTARVVQRIKGPDFKIEQSKGGVLVRTETTPVTPEDGRIPPVVQADGRVIQYAQNEHQSLLNLIVLELGRNLAFREFVTGAKVYIDTTTPHFAALNAFQHEVQKYNLAVIRQKKAKPTETPAAGPVRPLMVPQVHDLLRKGINGKLEGKREVTLVGQPISDEDIQQLSVYMKDLREAAYDGSSDFGAPDPTLVANIASRKAAQEREVAAEANLKALDIQLEGLSRNAKELQGLVDQSLVGKVSDLTQALATTMNTAFENLMEFDQKIREKMDAYILETKLDGTFDSTLQSLPRDLLSMWKEYDRKYTEYAKAKTNLEAAVKSEAELGNLGQGTKVFLNELSAVQAQIKDVQRAIAENEAAIWVNRMENSFLLSQYYNQLVPGYRFYRDISFMDALANVSDNLPAVQKIWSFWGRLRKRWPESGKIDLY